MKLALSVVLVVFVLVVIPFSSSEGDEETARVQDSVSLEVLRALNDVDPAVLRKLSELKLSSSGELVWETKDGTLTLSPRGVKATSTSEGGVQFDTVVGSKGTACFVNAVQRSAMAPNQFALNDRDGRLRGRLWMDWSGPSAREGDTLLLSCYEPHDWGDDGIPQGLTPSLELGLRLPGAEIETSLGDLPEGPFIKVWGKSGSDFNFVGYQFPGGRYHQQFRLTLPADGKASMGFLPQGGDPNVLAPR